MFLLVSIVCKSQAGNCNLVGVYEVTLEYSQKNWKHTLKTTFMVKNIDEKGEQVELYYLVSDTNRSVSFEKNKVLTDLHKRIFTEIRFVGKCKHSATNSGIVKHTDIHSSRFDFQRVSHKAQLKYDEYMCPLDIFYFGNNYKVGNTKVLPNSNNPQMPLSFNDSFKDNNYTVKRTVTKVAWSDKFITDFNNLTDLLYNKSRLQVNNSIDRYINSSRPSKYVFKSIIDNGNKINVIDSGIASIGGINRKLFYDSSVKIQHKYLDSIFTTITKSRYDSASFEYYNTSYNNLILPIEKCNIIDSILTGGYISGTVGILINLLTRDKNENISSLKENINYVHNSIEEFRNKYKLKENARKDTQSDLVVNNHKKDQLTSIINELTEINSNLLMKYKGKIILIDSNIINTCINGQLYFINSIGSLVDPIAHSNINDIIKIKLKYVYPEGSIDLDKNNVMIKNEYTAYDDLSKLGLKLKYIERIISKVSNFDKSLETHNILSQINNISSILSNSSLRFCTYRLETDRDLEKLLFPKWGNGGRKYLNSILYSYENGKFDYEKLFNSQKDDDIYNWYSNWNMSDSAMIRKGPLLITNGLRYINPEFLHDTMFLDKNLIQRLNSSIFNNITEDSLYNIFNQTRSNILQNALDPEIISLHKYGVSVRIDNIITDLCTSINNFIDKLSNKMKEIEDSIKSLSNAAASTKYTTEREFIESTDEYKTLIGSESFPKEIDLISVDSLVSIVQKRGKSFSMSDLDSLYALYNVKVKSPSNYIYLKSLEYGRELNESEEKEIWKSVLFDSNSLLEIPDIDSLFVIYEAKNHNEIYGSENPINHYIWLNGGMYGNLSRIQRRDIWRKVLTDSSADSKRALVMLMLDKLSKSDNGKYLMYNTDYNYTRSESITNIMESANINLIKYFLKQNVAFDKYCIRAAKYFRTLTDHERFLKRIQDSINQVKIYNELVREIIENKTRYEKKYPINPVNMRSDSLQLQLLTEKLESLKNIYNYIEAERSLNLYDPDYIESNIPSVDQTDIYYVMEEYQSSRGTSTMWNSTSNKLKEIVIDQFMKKKLYAIWSNWRNIAYNIQTGEWVLLATMDNYNQLPPPGNACDYCCVRMGFTVNSNSITINSFYVFSDCY